MELNKNGAPSEERLIGIALGQALGVLRGLRGEGSDQDRFSFAGIDRKKVTTQLESLEKGSLSRLKALPVTPENVTWRPFVKLSYELVRAVRLRVDDREKQRALEAHRLRTGG